VAPALQATPQKGRQDDNNAALASYQRQVLHSYGVQGPLPETVG
jgi:hypothetical protein